MAAAAADDTPQIKFNTHSKKGFVVSSVICQRFLQSALSALHLFEVTAPTSIHSVFAENTDAHISLFFIVCFACLRFS